MKNVISDKLRDIVEAGSKHMTGGDYEDPEDLVYATKNTLEDLYSRRVDGLYVRHGDAMSAEFTPYFQLLPEERPIYDSLKRIHFATRM